MPRTNHVAKSWANSPASGLDLYLELTRAGPAGGGLRTRIEEALREAIRSGRLGLGDRLPATRALARDLGVSRGTVLQAYDQLIAEGWLEGRPGSATLVCFDSAGHPPRHPMREPPPLRWRFDFRPGRPDASSFPRRAWLRAARRAIAAAPNDAFSIGDPQGQLALRVELSGYLSRARGLASAPDRLVVTSGFIQGLGLVARSLPTVRGKVAMEDPCLPLHRAVVRATGHEVVPVAVDGDGMRVSQLRGRDDIGLVVLTPNRQHPTGTVLSPHRRAELVQWARGSGALVLEDDYDGEFRYDRHPLGALQTLDPGVVIYAGTVSKTLAPGVRLGWLVVPEGLLAAVLAHKAHADWQSGALDQLAFTELLRSGAYDRHVRRMRLSYRRRRDLLIQALAAARPDLAVTGADAGLDLLIPLPSPGLEAAALAAARAAGIGLDGLAAGSYYERGGPAGLLVGYGATLEATFSRATTALAAALAASSGTE